jgi:hypothetical protein
MATKKPNKTAKQKSAARKLTASAKSTRQRAGAAPKSAARKKAVAGASRRVAKKVTRKKAPAHTARVKAIKKTRVRAASAASLGRPRVPGDAKLDLVFRKDPQAREVFAFLGVNTVRELEKFGPDEIIRRLTGPMVQTVGRIRKGMAMCNRSLSGDHAFALEFQRHVASYVRNEK